MGREQFGGVGRSEHKQKYDRLLAELAKAKENGLSNSIISDLEMKVKAQQQQVNKGKKQVEAFAEVNAQVAQAAANTAAAKAEANRVAAAKAAAREEANRVAAAKAAANEAQAVANRAAAQAATNAAASSSPLLLTYNKNNATRRAEINRLINRQKNLNAQEINAKANAAAREAANTAARYAANAAGDDEKNDVASASLSTMPRPIESYLSGLKPYESSGSYLPPAPSPAVESALNKAAMRIESGNSSAAASVIIEAAAEAADAGEIDTAVALRTVAVAVNSRAAGVAEAAESAKGNNGLSRALVLSPQRTSNPFSGINLSDYLKFLKIISSKSSSNPALDRIVRQAYQAQQAQQAQASSRPLGLMSNKMPQASSNNYIPLAAGSTGKLIHVVKDKDNKYTAEIVQGSLISGGNISEREEMDGGRRRTHRRKYKRTRTYRR